MKKILKGYNGRFIINFFKSIGIVYSFLTISSCSDNTVNKANRGGERILPEEVEYCSPSKSLDDKEVLEKTEIRSEKENEISRLFMHIFPSCKDEKLLSFIRLLDIENVAKKLSLSDIDSYVKNIYELLDNKFEELDQNIDEILKIDSQSGFTEKELEEKIRTLFYFYTQIHNFIIKGLKKRRFNICEEKKSLFVNYINTSLDIAYLENYKYKEKFNEEYVKLLIFYWEIKEILNNLSSYVIKIIDKLDFICGKLKSKIYDINHKNINLLYELIEKDILYYFRKYKSYISTKKNQYLEIEEWKEDGWEEFLRVKEAELNGELFENYRKFYNENLKLRKYFKQDMFLIRTNISQDVLISNKILEIYRCDFEKKLNNFICQYSQLNEKYFSIEDLILDTLEKDDFMEYVELFKERNLNNDYFLKKLHENYCRYIDGSFQNHEKFLLETKRKYSIASKKN